MINWVDRSARERFVSRRSAWAAIIVPLAGLAVVLGVRVLSIETFRFLIEEDGLVEWLQFACFLAAAIIGGIIAIRRWGDRHLIQALVYASAAIGLFFVAGEEIAWGTRLMALETPEWLREINLQEEVTLHNVEGVLFWFNMVLLGTALYGMVADPLNWRTRIAERWSHGRALFVPPFFLVSAFGVMAVLRIYRLIVGGPSQYTVTKLIEWAEMCYAAAVVWFVWLALRALRAARTDGSHSAVNGPDADSPSGAPATETGARPQEP